MIRTSDKRQSHRCLTLGTSLTYCQKCKPNSYSGHTEPITEHTLPEHTESHEGQCRTPSPCPQSTCGLDRLQMQYLINAKNFNKYSISRSIIVTLWMRSHDLSWSFLYKKQLNNSLHLLNSLNGHRGAAAKLAIINEKRGGWSFGL